MKLMLNGFIPPRPIDPREAARMLMDERHIAIMGSHSIAEHRRVIEHASELLPGWCAIMNCQAEWRWTPGCTKHYLTPATTTGGAGFITLFIPDSAEGRLAVAAALARYIPGALTGAPKDARAPILMLDNPDRVDDAALRESYAVIVESLLALGQGRAIDTFTN